MVSSSSEESIQSMLSGGDRRSLGRAAEVAALVMKEPDRVENLLACLWDEDACVRMRAADATEKISRERVELVQPFKPALLELLIEATQPEVRWHLASILPRLRLTGPECRGVADVLYEYLEDRSSIVKTFALQGLSDLTRQDADLLPVVLDTLRKAQRSGTPAMRARSRILLEQLEP